jgi:hypothetical protein
LQDRQNVLDGMLMDSARVRQLKFGIGPKFGPDCSELGNYSLFAQNTWKSLFA